MRVETPAPRPEPEIGALTDLEALLADIDYPMFIVTAHDGVRRAGCLVGFATQASIDPPRLLILLSHRNETFRVAGGASSLVVHFLDASNHDLATLFGEQSGDWTDKFDDCDWVPSDDGTPILSGVGGWVSGQIIERLTCGDHTAHLIAPTDVGRGRISASLTFQQVRDMRPGHDA